MAKIQKWCITIEEETHNVEYTPCSLFSKASIKINGKDEVSVKITSKEEINQEKLDEITQLLMNGFVIINYSLIFIGKYRLCPFRNICYIFFCKSSVC